MTINKLLPQTAVSAAVLLFLSGAQAQQQASPTNDAASSPAALDKVQITGSRINLKQSQISGVGPVTVIDSDAIQRSGAVSAETLLQRLPASAGAAGSQSSAYWTGNGYGTTQVNLRGLGINRTLVLLNGRRVVNGGTGANSAVDLNMIPVALIERVEVLKDGASAIYGADAVAGVVNIITKKKLQGLEAAVRYGETSRGDGDESAVDLAWGLSGAQGSLMTAINYAQSGDVNMASRAPCGLGEAGGKLVCVGSSATIGGRARLADGRRINFRQSLDQPVGFYEPYAADKHNYNGNPSLNAVNPVKRLGLNTFGTLNLNERTQLFTELMFSRRESSQLATPGSLGVYRAVNIAADHPGNPTGQALVLERRRLEEGGVRHFFQEANIFRAVAGAKGTLGEQWDWSLALNWGRNTGTDGSTKVANLDRVEQTLDRSRCSTAANAAIPCGNYLGYGSLTPEVLRYILATTRDTGGNDQKSLSASISGQLFELPAGPVGFASGLELRKEGGWRDPDNLTVIGAANTNRQDPIAGEYSARELFAELSVPLLERMPLIQSLTLNTAARYSDYSLFGSKSTYKLGLDWQVVPSLKLRSNLSSAFRVPNIPELYGGVSEGNLTTTDPCSGWSALSSSSVVYQNCQAAGVPVGFRQLGNTILTTVGGNPQLNPEDAKTLTAGIVWSPMRSLTLTLDYYRIKISNAIQSVAGSTKLATCYNTPGRAHIFCGPASFTRNASTGEIDFLSSQPVNAADERISGLDLGLLYDFRLAGWNASLGTELSHLKNYEVRPFPGAAAIDYTGKITGGRGSYTQWRALSTLTLARGAWSGSYTLQYIGAADDINAAPTDIGARAPAITYHSAQAKYAVSKSFDLALGIDNLFDKKAPFIKSYTDANTDTMSYDLLGRRWHLRAAYRW
ncbi:TonB-dependent receptor [Roseateles sp. DAIF2]|uniref:TonB-dependent receptor n=1 Tax=Roseateles sp. DAIF2 TaxID=2714952 RepID=UPI0018A29FBA|nr:TonB-dependent receptor [Roseateles sp. DAIF2]QPF74526.1 TonB-dependent receptor [Roseateles sp. DAIF2]